MDQIASSRPKGRLSKAAKMAGLILGGTIAAALIIGWSAFLLWLAAKIVIAVAHWL